MTNLKPEGKKENYDEVLVFLISMELAIQMASFIIDGNVEPGEKTIEKFEFDLSVYLLEEFSPDEMSDVNIEQFEADKKALGI